ncbi:MAG: glycogen synthase GlgA [Nitrospina sp.]|jgi:starch synthase|nr:glycogen synthase GlgA [Nitrospina sp.]MBT6718294.1 glycogen synthase GlgA [Nitrospina sp.]
MSSSLKILLVAAEVFPFAKTGGLADVAGSLPSSLKKLGHDVRVLLPKYPCTESQPIRSLDLEIEIPNSTEKATLFEGQLPENVPVYLVGNDTYFDREHLYGEPGTEYSDNAERFAFLSQAALETCKALDFQPDIIHCNDWHTGLIPVYLKSLYLKKKWYSKIRTLFSIHNLGYQGNFSMEKFSATGLPDKFAGSDGIEFYGKISFLKSGLLFSDTLNTVSPRYCQEIQTAGLGFGMEGILQQRSKDLTGILNGVDYSVWNPATDKLIAEPYDSLSKKQKCREALINKFSLKIDKNTPLLCMISRLSSQKGIDLLMEVSEDIKEKKLALLVLGQGDSKYESFFSQLSDSNPNRYATALTFDDTLAHQILAGSDMFLMPSTYEPCGLTQMYALKYGTVPLVSSVGGLDDSIQTFDGKIGTGFKFAPNDKNSLLLALKKALACFSDKSSWECLVNNGMSKDFSWDNAGGKYSDLYQEIYNSAPSHKTLQ